MAAWPRSKGFRRSGLDGAERTAKVLENCRSRDFLSIVMGDRTYAQHLKNWGTAEGVNPLGPLEIL
jgi:hypothetical protein